MIRVVLLVSLIWFNQSCAQKTDRALNGSNSQSLTKVEGQNKLPECIEAKLNQFQARSSTNSNPNRLIRFTSNGNDYFLFDEGMAVDIPGTILNGQCDTICYIGGRRLPSPDEQPCPEEDEGSRRVIWPLEKEFD